MPNGRPDLVTLRHTFGTLTKEFGARHADEPDAATRNPRLQLGQALERLYTALNDLNRGEPLSLRHVWSDSPDATLLTPTAGLTRGWDAILNRRHEDATSYGWSERYRHHCRATAAPADVIRHGYARGDACESRSCHRRS